MFDLSLEMLRVVEEAAISSARTMGMGDGKLSDQAAVEAMRRCLDTLAIEGKGGPGFVKGSARIQLKEKGAETELRCEAEAQVGGMIAAIGSRLIEAIGKKMMDDFFKKFDEQVKKLP